MRLRAWAFPHSADSLSIYYRAKRNGGSGCTNTIRKYCRSNVQRVPLQTSSGTVSDLLVDLQASRVHSSKCPDQPSFRNRCGLDPHENDLEDDSHGLHHELISRRAARSQGTPYVINEPRTDVREDTDTGILPERWMRTDSTPEAKVALRVFGMGHRHHGEPMTLGVWNWDPKNNTDCIFDMASCSICFDIAASNT